MPLRLVLADDAALIRQALAELLQQAGVEVVAQAGNAPSLVRAVENNRPDVAIIDIRMPPTQTREGIHAALEIRELSPAVGILLLSTHTQIDDADEPFPATATRVGYLLKDSMSDLDELTGALTRISEGGTVLDPSSSSNCSRPDSGQTPSTRSRHENARCSRSWPKGQSNAGIAKTLWITRGAAEKQIKHIFAKLGIPATSDTHRRVLAAITFLEPVNLRLAGSMIAPRPTPAHVSIHGVPGIEVS
jgi:serine/threonine-protein kinase PknK